MITIEQIKKQIRFYPDFPSKGINFIDLLPLMSNALVFREVVNEINSRITARNVAAPEARGFLFAAPLLLLPDGVENFIPFRKSGKLPAAENDLVKVSIVKEYGDDSLYFRKSDLEAAAIENGTIEVTIFDDVLATGGTAEGMAEHLASLIINGKPVHVREFVFLVEIEALGGVKRLEKLAPVHSIIKY